MSDWNETCAKCRDGEIEPRHCEYYGEPNGCNSPTYGEYTPVGNAAAMREALKFCLRIIGKNGIRGNVFLGDIQEAHRAITVALSAPPRQCDVGTAEEQAERFHAFCDGHSSGIGGMCDGNCPCFGGVDGCHCLCKWAQMPYEEGE